MFTVTKDTKIIKLEDILNVKINHFSDLFPIIKDYLKCCYDNIKFTSISGLWVKWKNQDGFNGYCVQDHFEVRIYNENNICYRKFRFGEFNGVILVQLLTKDTFKNRYNYHFMHIFDKHNTFLNFLINIKNDDIHKDEDLIKCLCLDY